MERIHKILRFVDHNKLYPDLRVSSGLIEPVTIVDGREVLMFCSNNYLGLATHPKIISAAIEALKTYGVGSDGSRLLSGNLKIHEEFERAIALFKGGTDAIVWPSGYAANVGVLTAYLNPIKVSVSNIFERGAVVLSDEYNHASIIDGIKMSGAKCVIYRHNDLNDLESKLKKYKNRRILVVTDGVFSMDGDIAPMDEIVKLCKKYHAASMVDEAHSTGIFGDSGHGILEYFGLKPVHDVDIVMGTCSKALANVGGFVVASPDLVRYLRVASRSYMFSTAMPPTSSAALIAALRVIEEEPERRVRLHLNARRLREGLHKLGFQTFGSETQIIPILIGGDNDAIEFSRKLFQRGFFAPCVRWPAVPKNMSRIRFTLMSSHTDEQIDRLISACEEILKEIPIEKSLKFEQK